MSEATVADRPVGPRIDAVCGGAIVTDRCRTDTDLLLADGCIAALPGRLASGGRLPDGVMFDATGCYVAPGFVDLQVNGGFGVDLTSEPQRVAELARALPRTGVTSFLPTVITGPAAQRERAVARLGAHTGRPTAGCARVIGIHVEGPYLAPQRRGTHPAAHLRLPDLAEAERWAADPAITMVTLAPELPGAAAAAEVLDRAGVVVSVGHSDASSADVIAAADIGHVRGVTHLFNAMSGLHHRRPGVAAAALTHRSLAAGLIVDGVHVDPTMVALAWRCLGPDRLVLVTDAMAAAGLGDGRYVLGEVEVTVDHGIARSAGDVLAGSVLTMDAAVRNLVAFTGCSVEDALAAATSAPAALLRSSSVGSIAAGRPADLVVLDEDLHVVATIVGGDLAHDRDGRAVPVAT